MEILEVLVGLWLLWCVCSVFGGFMDKLIAAHHERQRKAIERENARMTFEEFRRLERKQIAKLRRQHARREWRRAKIEQVRAFLYPPLPEPEPQPKNLREWGNRGLARLRAKAEADRARASGRRSA